MDNNKIANELNDLLKRNYDAEAGYKEAAKSVDDTNLKSFFNEQAQKRYDFGHKVKEEILQLGKEPNKGTSIEGDLHRTWLNVKDALSSGNKALVDEVIRGEKAAMDEYQEFMNKDYISEQLKNEFREQKNSIETAINKLQTLS